MQCTSYHNFLHKKIPYRHALQGNGEMGARYLDPKYSRWISTDPALGKYVAGKSNSSSGGIYNSTNLNLYHYANNNPINYIDPDGKEDWQPLKYNDLWWIAFQSRKIHEGQTAQNNQIVGSAFEKAVGQIFGLPKTVLFNSSVRQSSVIPDFTAKLLVFTYSKDEVKFSDFYVHGIFIEAKTSKSVGLDGSTPGQMKAMVDACANQISYKGLVSGKEGDARLYIITLSDTIISDELKNYATSKNVSLYQYKAMYDKDDVSRIKLSPGILLNPKPDMSVFIPTSEPGEGKLTF